MNQTIFFALMFGVLGSTLFPMGVYFSLKDMILVYDWNILMLGGGLVEFSFILDSVSILFSSAVFLISANVMWFSVGYMNGELFMKRFIYLVFLFVVSMNLLVYSCNLITVLLGWDGLGLTSFLLVIYYQNSYSLGAGLITVLTNRLGDVGLILSIGLMLGGGHWFIPCLETGSLVSCLVILGAITKSAQFPFSAWLPMAMAAPTPVSALVHSSTLVTAGVYLLIRFHSSVFSSLMMSNLLLGLSSLTMVLAGLAAFVEVDFKKIIAYSTLSQLGVMMVALGLGSPMLSFFHLLSHAMFKALMFICAGTYIHYHGHAQDLRVMGNLSQHLPVIQVGANVSNLALCGFPFLSGFYSKDPIYEFSVMGSYNFIVVFFMLFGLLLTSIYSSRAVLLSQVGVGGQVPLSNFHNESTFFVTPVVVLGSLAVFWGATLNWILLPPLGASPVSLIVGGMPVVLFVLGVGFMYKYCVEVKTYEIYGLGKSLSSTLHDGFLNIWFLSIVSSQYVIKDVLWAGSRFLSVTDQGWVEMMTGQGVSSSLEKGITTMGLLGRSCVTTNMLIGVIVFIGVFKVF